MGIFDFLKRRKSNDYIDPEKVKRTRNSTAVSVVKADLNRLNNTMSGLGTKAAQYVLTGQNETVLSTLANGAYSEPLNLNGSYAREKPSRNRRLLFARLQPYDIELVVRYAKVLHAASDINSNL